MLLEQKTQQSSYATPTSLDVLGPVWFVNTQESEENRQILHIVEKRNSVAKAWLCAQCTHIVSPNHKIKLKFCHSGP